MPRKPNYDREDLIERARDLFWKRGWAGTSLKDLEAELQMKPGSFYAAFGSKEALFELAMEKYATGGRAWLAGLAAQKGPLRALQDCPAMMIGKEDSPAKACMLCKTLLELAAHDHPLAEKANTHLKKMEDQIRDLFSQAQDKGEIAKDTSAHILARRYQSDLIGLRVSAERRDVDAGAIAKEIAEELGRL